MQQSKLLKFWSPLSYLTGSAFVWLSTRPTIALVCFGGGTHLFCDVKFQSCFRLNLAEYQTKMEKVKLDFRFASVDDAPELTIFLNESRERECTGTSAFRSEGSRVEETAIEHDCGSMSTRWVVLETPVPEEKIVAAAKFNLLIEGAVVGCLCVCKEAQSTAVERVLLGKMLAKIENVVISHGKLNITVEALQWQDQFMNWLESCGYEEMGGYLSDDATLSRPTMVLTYKKVLSETTLSLTSRPIAIRDSSSSSSFAAVAGSGSGPEAAAAATSAATDVVVDGKVGSRRGAANRSPAECISVPPTPAPVVDSSTTVPSDGAASAAADEIISSSALDDIDLDFSTFESVECEVSAGAGAGAGAAVSGAGDASMEKLMADLFKALHNDLGSGSNVSSST